MDVRDGAATLCARLVASDDVPPGAVVEAAGEPGLLFAVVGGPDGNRPWDGLAVALAEVLDRAWAAGVVRVELTADVPVDDRLLKATIVDLERNRPAFFVLG